jgi:hypothetical protein
MSTIAQDVERGLEIRARIEALSEELKLIEERLKQAGISAPDQHVELADEEREGRQFLARGRDHIVPVVFTADVIVQSFQQLSPLHTQLKVIAREDLTTFFKPPTKYENRFESGKKFRQQAHEVLGARAPVFISACVAKDRKTGIAKSAIKVEWSHAAPVESLKG